MDRRRLVFALALAPLAARAQDDAQRPRHKISAARLHEALSARFPLGTQLAGVLQLQVSAQALLLLPARNKLGATLVLEVSGPALRRPEQGELDLVFGLRYEPADRSLRAQEPEILEARFPGVRADITQVLQSLLPALSREIAGDLVLHRFAPGDLALSDTMGFEPGRLTVQEDGLLVEFVTKAR